MVFCLEKKLLRSWNLGIFLPFLFYLIIINSDRETSSSYLIYIVIVSMFDANKINILVSSSLPKTLLPQKSVVLALTAVIKNVE